MDKIKPCLFCRTGLPSIASDFGVLPNKLDKKMFWVHCGRCLAEGPVRASPGSAIRAWNEPKGCVGCMGAA